MEQGQGQAAPQLSFFFHLRWYPLVVLGIAWAEGIHMTRKHICWRDEQALMQAVQPCPTHRMHVSDGRDKRFYGILVVLDFVLRRSRGAFFQNTEWYFLTTCGCLSAWPLCVFSVCLSVCLLTRASSPAPSRRRGRSCWWAEGGLGPPSPAPTAAAGAGVALVLRRLPPQTYRRRYRRLPRLFLSRLQSPPRRRACASLSFRRPVSEADAANVVK